MMGIPPCASEGGRFLVALGMTWGIPCQHRFARSRPLTLREGDVHIPPSLLTLCEGGRFLAPLRNDMRARGGRQW